MIRRPSECSLAGKREGNDGGDREQHGRAQFRAAEPVASACRRATARDSGVPVLGDPEVTPAGIRVRLSSWPRQQEALAALRLLGYQVAGEGRDGEHGAALVVAAGTLAGSPSGPGVLRKQPGLPAGTRVNGLPVRSPGSPSLRAPSA